MSDVPERTHGVRPLLGTGLRGRSRPPEAGLRRSRLSVTGALTQGQRGRPHVRAGARETTRQAFCRRAESRPRPEQQVGGGGYTVSPRVRARARERKWWAFATGADRRRGLPYLTSTGGTAPRPARC